jgi:hypothetical protein
MISEVVSTAPPAGGALTARFADIAAGVAELAGGAGAADGISTRCEVDSKLAGATVAGETFGSSGFRHIADSFRMRATHARFWRLLP